MTEDADKARWRARFLAARRNLQASELAAAATALGHHLAPRLAGLDRIAAYVPAGREPGSLDLLDGLRRNGTTVLLPIVSSGTDLDWAVYGGRGELAPGAVRAGRSALPEPTGPRLGTGALAEADLVLVPALGVDHRGIRLGRGAGYYDRALAALPASTPVVALLHDGELVPRLPADPWDRKVTSAATPASGWTELPPVPHHVR